MAQQPDINGRSWITVCLLGFTWGGTFLITEIALEGITPFWLAAGRIGFAAILMLAIWLGRGAPLFAEPPTRRVKLTMFVMGWISSALPFMLLAWGQQYVTGGFAGVTMAAIALLVLPLSHFFVPGESLTWRKSIGFVIGFFGVVMLIGGQAFENTGAALETAGRLACITAAFCYAVNSILMRRLPAADTVGLATVLLLMSAVIVIPIALMVEGLPPMPSHKTLFVLAFLGLVPTAAANFLRTYVIRTAGPVFMSITNYQVPIWSVLLGAALLGEPLTASLIWAMLLILAGVGLSQYGAFTRLFGQK